MLQALLLFALLLTGALAGHDAKQVPGLNPNGHQTATPTTDVIGGLDPNGLQAAGPTSDLIGGLDPDGAR